MNENKLNNEDMFVKELTSEEIVYLKQILGNFAFNNLGDRLFRLPGGAITGIGGVDLFNKAIRENLKKDGTNL